MTSDFEKLAWKYLDGSLSEEESSRFLTQLRDNSECCDALISLSLYHYQIREVLLEVDSGRDALAKSGLQMVAQELVEGSRNIDLHHEQPSSVTVSDLSRSTPHRLVHPVSVALLSICATLLLLLFGGWLKSENTSRQIADQGAAIKNSTRRIEKKRQRKRQQEAIPVAAMLTGVVDCRWEPGYEASYGEFLPHGRELQLHSGLAQLTFESGAKLVLQGPVAFRVQSEMHAEISEGKMTALCPQEASGFKLRTPSAEIIDIGTEFAVQVAETGESEIHVLKGEVISRGLDPLGNAIGESVSVTGNTAIQYDSLGNSNETPLEFNGGKFVRDIHPRLTELELPPLTVHRDLVLWLAADVLVKIDDKGGENRVLAWRDIEFGDNQLAEDAIGTYDDTRPRWIPEAINGKPAIHFDGKSYLVTSPLKTTKNQSVFVVFQREVPEFRDNLNYQLITYNGPPQQSPVNGMQSGMLQIGNFGMSSGNGLPLEDSISAFVYSVHRSVGEKSGFTVFQEVKPNVPMVLSYIYDYDGNAASLAINGQLHSVAEATQNPQNNSRKVIGRHAKHLNFFEGDIAEILIYNTTLSDFERMDVEDYLIKKYGTNSRLN